MPVKTSALTVKDQQYDIVLHRKDDGGWYGEATKPPLGKDMKVAESGASESEVIEKIRKRLEAI